MGKKARHGGVKSKKTKRKEEEAVRQTTRALPELHAALTLVDGEDDGSKAFEERGVWTTAAGLERGTMLVSVHWDELLTMVVPIVADGDHASMQRARCLGAALQSLDREDDILALRLLYEQSIGSDSRWAEHIALLPSSLPHCLLHWTNDELRGLVGTSIEATTRAWRAQSALDFGTLFGTTFELDGETKTIGATFGDSWFSSERYAWALSMIWSRFVSVEKEGVLYKSMAPTFDLFNHSSDARETHTYDDAGNCLRLITLGTVAGVAAGDAPREWRANEEVCINYGLGNAKLLLHHGFVESHETVNSKDAVPLTLGLCEGMAKLDEKRAALADSLWKITDASAVTVEMSVADPIPPILITMLRLRRADESTTAEQIVAALDPSSSADASVFGAPVEAAALADLKAAVAPMLARLVGGAAVDDEELESSDDEDDGAAESAQAAAERTAREDASRRRGAMADRLRTIEGTILEAVLTEINTRQMLFPVGPPSATDAAELAELESME